MKEIIPPKNLSNLPLSSNQTRLWVLTQQDKDNPSYNIPIAYHFKAEINVDLLNTSLNILFNQHYSLFSVVKQNQGYPFIEILPHKVETEFVDFSSYPAEKAKDALLDFIGSDSRKSFDLEKGPLFRLYILKENFESYYFYLNIHHIIFDGWSLRVFLEHLDNIYNNLATGAYTEPQVQQFQSYEFANLEESILQADENKFLVNFWKDTLKGSNPSLKLSYDSPNKGTDTGWGEREPIVFSSEVTKKLKQFAKEKNSTLFKVLLSSIGLFLQKYSGENDISIGIPISKRRLNPDSNSVIGFFVGTSVVRLNQETDPSFNEFLDYSTDVINKAITNSKLPFDKIVEAVNPERTLINPLYNVSFSWANNVFIPLNLNGNTGVRAEIPYGVTVDDLSFYLWEDGEFIKGNIEYNVTILNRDTIKKIKNYLLNFIETLCSEPERNISKVSLAKEKDIREIDILNNTRTEYPKDKTVIEIFEEQVSKYPFHTAVVHNDQSLTFQDLNIKANKLAHKLIESGVCPNTPVAILMDKSIDLIIGILGILKAGGGYVPIDPEYPSQRRDFILKDSGSTILLTQNKYMDISTDDVTKIDISNSSSYSEIATSPALLSKPSGLAYILYTSGTTGIPKGTTIPHQGVVRLVKNTNYIDITHKDRVLQAGAIVFDASTFEIWGALLNGGSLYIIHKDTLLNINEFASVLADNSISVVLLTSSLFTQIAEMRADVFRYLRILLVGGDVLSAAHINKVKRNNPALTIINAYGPTENSCISTAYTIEKEYEYNIPIGKPISNSTAYIFDKHMNYQPVGVIGELYVGGDGLSNGYLNRDDLNKTSFVSHPFHPGERLYKTGDLARWLPNGNIEFHGRKDFQLKIRGFRVEPEEIEAVLSEIEGVVETVVKPVKMNEGDYKLVAFLNVSGNFSMEKKEIDKILKSKLPPYMIPSAYKFMHGFPKNVSGKIDRKSLIIDLRELKGETPRNQGMLSPAEKKLFEIWQELLKTDEISTDDNFFDIGGNSLQAIRLINKINEITGAGITFKDIITYPTIALCAEFIESLKTETKIELSHTSEKTNLPLTNNQKRLWLISKMNPDKASYIIPVSYKLTGELNRGVLQKSLEALFHRHEVVFSIIREKNNEPFCDIVPAPINISYLDYANAQEDKKAEKVNELIDADFRIPFNLEKGPLFRLYLVSTGPGEHYFHASIHHIVFDGWSQEIFVKDLAAIYNALINGREINLPPLNVQQYDYANWEKKKTENQDSAEFWKKYMEGSSSILNFPYDYQRKEQNTGRGSVEPIVFSKPLSEALRKISKEEGTSLFTTLVGILGLQMHIYSGENDLNLGLPIDSRPHSQLEKIFGMFVNTVVVRLKYEKGITFKEILKQASTNVLDAIGHQDIPFERLVELIKPERIPNANPLFQVGMAWQNYNSLPLLFDGIQSESLKRKDRAPIFDINFYLSDNGENIEGEIEYSLDLLKPESILRLRDNFTQLAESLTENPDSDIEELAILTEHDKKFIHNFNETETPYEKETCIHEKFEQQTNKNGDLVALFDDNRSLTYKEFNEHANKMANFLIKQGVHIEDKVGVCMDRSIEMMVCIMGIIKAGGAYVPLNPENPSERLKSILEEATPTLVLTTRSASTNIPAGTHTVMVDDILINPLSEDSTNPEVKMSSESLAYVLYTSGSTGKPKGVMIEHHSVLNRLGWMQKAYPIDSNDTLIQKTPITFDVSVWELFWWFFNGAKLFLLKKGGEKDPEELIKGIEKHHVTTIHFVPSMFVSFFDTISTKNLFSSLKGLNRIFLSGEALPLKMVKDFNAERGSYKLPDLINLYGPTEATVDVSYYNCPKTEVENVFIGKPIDNTQLFVVNEKNVIRPIGVPGELLITGVNLARGYLNRPDLTQERFIDFKLNAQETIKAYRTGDLVKLSAQGEIDYIGRLDNQVKIRGFRIELGEIEAKIMEHSAINNCAVIVEDKGDYKFLVAYVSLKPEETSSSEELRTYLFEKLPDYMVPSFIVILPELPLTSSGKINRKALPKTEHINESKTLTPAANKTEKILTEIWKSILKVENLGTTDNFFDIGGNSILAINLANQISKETGVELKPLFIFEYPRIKEQSEYLSSAKKDDMLSSTTNEIDEKNQKRKSINFKRTR